MNERALLQKRVLLQCLIYILLLYPLAASAESITYQYDARHRLIGATYDSGKAFSYAYDGAGNRLQQTVVGTNISSNAPSSPAATALLSRLMVGTTTSNTVNNLTQPSQETSANATIPGSIPLLGFYSLNDHRNSFPKVMGVDFDKDPILFPYRF